MNIILKKVVIILISLIFVITIIVPCINSNSNIIINKNNSIERVSFNPFIEGWKYRKQITIDHTKVAGNLNNFPVLVSNIDPDLASKAQADGNDILFMTDIGEAEQLFHEIEFFDNSTGELVAWVNIPSIFNSIDIVFYMYYGNPDCSSYEISERIWDSNYQAVWHLSEDETDLRHDSTINIRHATPYNYDGDEATNDGIIGGADEFDGINDHLRTGVSFDYDFRTISFWIKTDVKPLSDPNAILSQNADTLKYGLLYANIQSDGLHAKAGGEGAGEEFIFDIDLNSWYMVQLIRDHLITKYYINGILVDTGDSGNLGSVWNPNPNLVIGSSREYDRLFEGILDEVRVSDIARSSGWILTEYNNQNNPSSFLSFGVEEIGLKSTFIIGSFEDIHTEGNSMIIDALNIRCIQTSPFAFVPYTSNEKLIISKDGYIGLLIFLPITKFIIAICNMDAF
ncbi:hypothetical protein AYK24_05335 [Thermoplasmatales archaeon SG8-52-4]|nr:MAG: hypothetical protein AYK24_05335 [Thermoplasmatales archaeon SG8-52-4]